MIWNTLRGHDDAVEMFRRAVRRNRLSHAYLFHGPAGIGKRRFAQLLAQCLLCPQRSDDSLDACGECDNCRKMQAGNHPDYLELHCPEEKSEFPLELIAGGAERRGREGLCYEISLRPVCGGRRIAVIDDADAFNAESANALLKTLEEPPSYSLLILLAEDPGSLLPTIRSRCQWLRFAPLSEEDVAELLIEQGWVGTPAEARSLAALCEGSLSVARQLLRPEIRQLHDAVPRALARPDFHAADTAEEITALIQACGETPAQRDAARWMIRFCIDVFRRELLNMAEGRGAGSVSDRSAAPVRNPPVHDTPVRGDAETLGCLIERCVEAEGQIAGNVQLPLCLQALFEDLSRMLRSVGAIA